MRLKSIFFLIIFCCVTSFALAAQRYRIVDLGIPKESHNSPIATSINDKGQICGIYHTKEEYRVFFWDPKTGFEDIGVTNPSFSLPPWHMIHSRDPMINNQGVIVGNYSLRDEKGNSRNSVFRWDRKNGFSDIGLDSKKNQKFLDINNLNYILFAHQNAKNEPSLEVSQLGSIFPLGDLFLDARINDHQEIFGFGRTNNGVTLRHYDLKTGEQEDLFFFKGYSEVGGFSNNGVAIGRILTPCGNKYGFTWSKKNGLELLHNFFPICVSENGQIVGDDSPHSPEIRSRTVLDNGEKTNLNESIAFDASTPWICIWQICDINHQGYMVGSATKYGSRHAVLLIPID